MPALLQVRIRLFKTKQNKTKQKGKCTISKNLLQISPQHQRPRSDLNDAVALRCSSVAMNVLSFDNIKDTRIGRWRRLGRCENWEAPEILVDDKPEYEFIIGWRASSAAEDQDAQAVRALASQQALTDRSLQENAQLPAH
jgi:hypothetical protein